ncbi:MAG: hypothetical protein JXC32_08525, partial [Anaerolineae bacterium]|nr:hypothetical protein [Anaerolineae bacterium]
PFFGHFFRWSQAGQVLAELGRTWQPFGGAGYFVLLALLVLSLVAAAALIGLPVVVARRAPATEFTQPPVSAGLLLTYFGLLGLGYLFVEIPLMQQTIRFLGYPARAVTVVLFTLLAFSGVGSALSSRLRMQPVWALAALVALIAGTAIGLPVLYSGLLSLPWGPRLVVTVAGLAPVGLLMGLPFPLGLRYAGTVAPQHVPWAWAANGAMSVVASVLSALVSLSVGFTWVLVAGAMAYALAALCTLPWRRDLY